MALQAKVIRLSSCRLKAKAYSWKVSCVKTEDVQMCVRAKTKAFSWKVSCMQTEDIRMCVRAKTKAFSWKVSCMKTGDIQMCARTKERRTAGRSHACRIRDPDVRVCKQNDTNITKCFACT